MIFNLTNVHARNLFALQDTDIRIAVNEGGTSSSKTFSILQLLIDLSVHRTKPLLTSVVSESLPHLKLGALRDFRLIMGDDYDERRWNATDHIYDFGAAQMEFFSSDNPGKVHGPRRDILFCNEVNNIPKPIYDALSVRTRRFELLDFNPVFNFWVHEMRGHKEVAWIHSTYLDAKHVLPKEIVEKIEARKERDPNWWNIYGLGKVGNIEGLVHPSVNLVDEMPAPELGGLRFYGLDFGYTNDPTCLTYNVIIGEDLYTDELIYETGLTNQAIARRFEQFGIKKGFDEIFADAAEPKSIDEIFAYGYNIKPCPKGPDSVENGIQKINQYRQHATKRSLNGIKEVRNYRFIADKMGKLTNKPIDGWNHWCDSRRYGVVGKLGAKEPFIFTSNMIEQE